MATRPFHHDSQPSRAEPWADGPTFMENDTTPPDELNSAINILHDAAMCISERAAERDQDSERSMGRCVAAFNALTGFQLSEKDGWMFMVMLKAARAEVGVTRDDFLDMAAYAALAGESALTPR